MADEDYKFEILLQTDQEKAKLTQLCGRIAKVLYTGGSIEEFTASLEEKLGKNKENVENVVNIVREAPETFVVLSSGGLTCQVRLELPAKITSKKAFIFMRVAPEAELEDEEDLEEMPEYTHIEVGNKPLELLYSLTNNIFVPILHNPANQDGWTELISKDLMEKLNNYVA